MNRWQFDHLTIEKKIVKWQNQNIEKALIIKINSETILKTD
ncbi:hypothetical protein ACFSTE_04980 [Aquimarina hainanensis]|uniref:Uncharacterized protein n=1 Tax=Aquimarina hainanensis TaxID=1578017 RepID=A0ABW5N506_9FLAO